MTKQQILELQDDSVFGKNLYKYVEFASWVNWYPDLFLDLITPETGGIKLHADQRIYLRVLLRFASTYGVFPRGWGKTFNEVLGAILVAIRFPDISIALTAQTKENAADLLKDKAIEIFKYYPMLENELAHKPKYSKGDAELIFKSGGKVDILANTQTSKGQRRKRINIEEAALLNDVLFQDALKPIVEVPRYTIGKFAVTNPEELNQQINFFTTAGFRGSDEYIRSIKMYQNMLNMTGDIVLGSSWQLACWYGRGSNKSQVLQKKADMSPIAFDQNYASKWVGSSDNALVNINKLMNCRSLTTPMLNYNKHEEEFYLGVDVARSQKTSNNQSSIAVGRVIRDKDFDRITRIEIPNIFTISNALNFTAQAAEVKKIKRNFNAQTVIVDGNGLGSGLIDELLKECYDPVTNEYLGCWNTINTDNIPEIDDAEKCLYDFKAQSIQSKVITNFIDSVDSGKLRLLCKKTDGDFTLKDREKPELNILPFVQTDLLFEEVANLKLKHLNNGALTVEKVVKKLDKDRWSSLAYLIWYIIEFKSNIKKNQFNAQDYTKALSKLNQRPIMY